MLTREEFEAILERIRTASATETDLADLRRSLKQSGKVVQIELQQEKFSFDIEQISGGEIQFGDRIYYGADAETIKAVLQSVLEEQQRILEQRKARRPRVERDFLGMMKAEVFDSLKQSLHHAVLMNLGKEEQPQQVERLWDAKIKVADQPNILLPNDVKTIEVFDRDDIAGRLLILGNPGSGKTTTLLELAKALIERAETEPDFPMPVLFNLSSWKDDKQPLHKWMVQELKLRVRSDITFKWLDKHKLLPLLDGLDEIAADRQETCVKAINQQLLTGEKSLPYLAVCSRNEEYDHYETKLLLNGAIFIQALTIDKIRSYLNSIDQSELCHTLDHDADLLALVRTPLFLSIAALSFQKLSQERWQTLTTTEARIEYLLDSYTRQMLERPIPHNIFGKWQLPSNQKTRKWLTWLAQQMQNESQFEFLIERMQPSLLPTSSKLRMYKLLTGLISGIIFGSTFFYITFGFNALYASRFPVGMSIFYTLRDGILFAITSGLACGISSIVRPFDSRQMRVKVRHRLLSGLIFRVLFGLYFWYFYNFNPITIETMKTFSFSMSSLVLVIAMFLGVFIAAMTGGLIRGLEAEISTVESLRWSSEEAVNRFKSEIRLGLMPVTTKDFFPVLFGIGLFSILLCFIIPAAVVLFALILFVRLTIMLVISLVSGLEGRDIERKLLPNQGVKRSLIISIASGFIGGLICLLFSGLCSLLITPLMNSRNGTVDMSMLVLIIASLTLAQLGLSFGVPILIRIRGGSACIRHCVLRLILHHSGYIPWNYAQFLNYCTERVLLQRVGGRYRFIHRLLQEHFAAMPFDAIEGDRQRSTP